MTIRFIRGDSQAPKGHAIFFARSATDSRTVLATYCVVPPMPLSLAKYLPSFLASQLSPEDLQEATNVPVMPIPPMLEEGNTFERLQMLAEQLVAQGCQEYGQFYVNFASSFAQIGTLTAIEDEAPIALDDLDADELLIQTMTDRQRLAELGKLVGVARYALEGRDEHQLQETRQRMRRVAQSLADKYRSTELTDAAFDPGERGARLAELYLERAYKLLDEEYSDIPGIERAIRELQ